MLSRTKRRLAVLALALGLIAAAPRMFHVAVDLLLPMGNLFGAGTGLGFGAFEYTRSNRGAIFAINPFAVTYMTEAARSSVWLECPRPPYLTIFKLPHASITLRVACAVALAGVWGLLVGGRWLVGRWTRSSPESQTAR